jgi:hypothetical protein
MEIYRFDFEDCLTRIQKALKYQNEKSNKLNVIENLWTSALQSTQLRNSPRRYSQNIQLTKDWQKNSNKTVIKRQMTQFKNWQKDFKQTLSK